MAFTIDTTIQRSPSEVFAYVADSRNTPHWYEAVRRADRLDDGPVNVGSRYRFERALPGGTAVNQVEVTELERDAVVTLTSIDGPTPFRYRYLFAPDGAGGTRLRLEGEIRGDGLSGPARALAALAPTLFAAGMRTNLERLKRLLER